MLALLSHNWRKMWEVSRLDKMKTVAFSTLCESLHPLEANESDSDIKQYYFRATAFVLEARVFIKANETMLAWQPNRLSLRIGRFLQWILLLLIFALFSMDFMLSGFSLCHLWDFPYKLWCPASCVYRAARLQNMRSRQTAKQTDESNHNSAHNTTLLHSTCSIQTQEG